MASFPPLPTLRELTLMLRDVNLAYSHPECGGEYVQLFCVAADFPYPAHWRVGCDPHSFQLVAEPCAHREYVPGDYVERDVGKSLNGIEYVERMRVSSWDAVGAARRLLAAARDV